ncbi:YceI family protein [Deinococcus koreensis]|uniref:Lipid/polyisoprenoid-binding YceI-like domain-containing protein n=1 Tax=Deinococcus koreensis TaxID=2054903 RepID=A0A2K3UTV2_9DEIO|nr:YceI family protein [Deinococcus koreensis]PNY79974.1 hypothetical protein CVO96_00145 [Deinococcus koreensis]
MRPLPRRLIALCALLMLPASAAPVGYSAGDGSATFDIRVLLVPVRGTIEGVSAEADVDSADLAATTGRVTVPLVNLKTGNGLRDSHARSEVALWAEKYPNAVFTLGRLTGGRLVEGTTLATTATGTLTVKATTRTISVPVKATLSGAQIRVSTQFKFNPYDFDVRYPGSATSVAVDVSFVLAAK